MGPGLEVAPSLVCVGGELSTPCPRVPTPAFIRAGVSCIHRLTPGGWWGPAGRGMEAVWWAASGWEHSPCSQGPTGALAAPVSDSWALVGRSTGSQRHLEVDQPTLRLEPAARPLPTGGAGPTGQGTGRSSDLDVVPSVPATALPGTGALESECCASSLGSALSEHQPRHAQQGFGDGEAASGSLGHEEPPHSLQWESHCLISKPAMSISVKSPGILPGQP